MALRGWYWPRSRIISNNDALDNCHPHLPTPQHPAVTWREDPYWIAAAASATAALDEADLVLVPHEFLDLDERFAPLEFSFGLDAAKRKIAYCCTKNDADRLADAVLSDSESRYRWANEVFVLGGVFKWQRADRPSLRQHLRFWQLMLDRRKRGAITREPAWRLAPGCPPDDGPGPKILVIGASGMGNIGDDLLAQVIAQMLLQQHGDARVWLSDSSIDPLELRRFDGVIVGGGGLVYASRDGSKEWQNLANYLKFGPIARRLGMPVAMIGVSDQDHAHAIERNELLREFARACLASFSPVSTRDVDSAALLTRLGADGAASGADLLFAWLGSVKPAGKAPRAGQARVALAGELLSAPVFERITAKATDIESVMRGKTFDFVLMSDDDVEHGRRTRHRFARAGANVEIVDLRGERFDAIVARFQNWQGLITTRFHGLVIAAMTGVPVLAIDGPEGKKARLLRELGASEGHLLDSSGGEQKLSARLCSALAGEISALPMAAVARHASQMQVHEQAIQRFVAEVRHARGARSGSGAKVVASALAAVRWPGTPRALKDERSLQERLTAGGEVGLCWAASSRDTNGYANLGDALSAVIVSALSGMPVRHVNFNESRSKLVAVGSIGHAIVGGEAVLWGTGVSIRGGVLVRNVPRTRYDIRSIRGRISAGHFRNLGVHVPEIYGDPVWFLPSIFHEPVDQKWELGVIPHIQDVAGYGPDARPPADSLRYKIDAADADTVRLINTWHSPTWEGMKQTLRQIRECKRIASQSFHGVVIAEAYGIPVLNFRQLGGRRGGLLHLRLDRPCVSDPRIHEFYDGGRAQRFPMYAQRRDQRTDWQAVIRAVDSAWQPFEYDPFPLLQSFPLPLAHDPLTQRLMDLSRISAIRF
jgi:polysaccharide pyruvyl transferase WcaK-like protein